MAQLTTSTSIFFSIFSFLFTACFAIDTIYLNQPITGANKLLSNGQNFELGFFQPDTKNNNQKHYIGIWYHMNKVSQLTSVWEANREAPVTDPNSSQLKISDVDGNLVLLDESKAIVWSTNVSIPHNMSTIAVLLDNGNLQLIDESNASTILWQSFDHPTNTWLPGAKFVYNMKTNKSQQLTSWKNSIDLAPGIFSIQYSTSRGFYTMWNSSVIYWSSGSWNGNDHSFANTPEMIGSHTFRFYYVDTAQESYFTFLNIDNSSVTRIVIDISGQLQQLKWEESSKQWLAFWSAPTQQCNVYAACGAYGVCNEDIANLCSCPEGFSAKNPTDWALGDYSSGCVRDKPLQCQTSSSTSTQTEDEFQVMWNTRLPINSHMVADKSDESCKMACLENCLCTAYSYNNISGCSVWQHDLLDLQEEYDGSDAATLYLRVSPLKSLRTKSKNVMLLVVVSGSLMVIPASLIVIIALIIRGQRRLTVKTRNVATGTVEQFEYSELKFVTKNFSEKLGSGGFGTVFKGALPDSTAIAVKKLEGILQGEKQFRAEVTTIGTLQHVNLVRLLGFCSEEKKRLLVYQYMPRGSLATQIFGESTTVLNWQTRSSIAIGIARGLSYLHEQCRQHIIHCDIKPDNILLDESFVPKVADFGLAKLLGRDFSRVLTTMRGTQGYLAPEWIKGIAITAKADVYSYGMMLFEIISGRRNFEHTDECVSSSLSNFFPTFAAAKLIAGDINSLLDPRITGDVNLGEVERTCKLAFWCVQDDEKLRPTMSQVVHVLEGFLDINMPPIPTLFRNGDEGLPNFSFSSSTDKSKSDNISLTLSEILVNQKFIQP